MTVGTDLKYSDKQTKSIELSQIVSDDIRVDTELMLRLDRSVGSADIGGDVESAWSKLENNQTTWNLHLTSWLVMALMWSPVLALGLGRQGVWLLTQKKLQLNKKPKRVWTLGTAKAETSARAMFEKSASSKAKKIA